MRLPSWLYRLDKNGAPRGKARRRTTGPRFRPRVRALEDRCLLSTVFVRSNLVSDATQFAPAQVQDPNLVNPWGLAADASGAWWVANEGTGTSTLYDTSKPQASVVPLVVNVPPNPADNPLPSHGSPTGIVFNTSATGFNVSEAGKTGSSVFLFATTDGTISGWSPGVDVNNAVIGATNAGALYLGLAIATDSAGATLLYAANFGKGTIDVFDQNFNLVTTLAGNFTDPNLPSGYSPFNIQAIGNQLYVEYAPVNAILSGTAGPGEGVVDVYNADGQLQESLIQGGHLDQPWAVAMAPSGFGRFSNDLLVGNFGDGQINAFNPTNGQFVGVLKDAGGQPVTVRHLWGMAFGNGGAAGPTNTLYFTAGLSSHLAPSGRPFHGLFGSIQPTHEQGPQDDAPMMSASIMASPTTSSPIAPAPTMPASAALTSAAPASSMPPAHGSPEQQTDAVFKVLGAGLSPLDSHHTAMRPQRPGLYAMLDSGADALDATLFDRLHALESGGLGST
jgi:uncharacterized protein (TIGR03118 family)